MYLVFDTETTGLPLDWNAPASDIKNWPRIVQFSWLVYDKNGNEISMNNFIVKPDGFEIPQKSTDVHGITTERAIDEGYELREVLAQFYGQVKICDFIVAHNLKFDDKVIACEIMRTFGNGVFEEYQEMLSDKKKVDTMLASVDFCAIPNTYGFKWPKLDELYQKLFNEGFADAHNALYDTRACAKCFFELRQLEIIKL